jgi:6-phosphofructokinase
MTKHIGILTAGGDSPGLNAAIRGVGKAAQSHYDMQMIGFLDGFRGLVDNRSVRMEGDMLSDILTRGGTILGTSRDKPHRMMFGGKKQDMTNVIVENYNSHHLDALVCVGGGGTQKNALQLMDKGLNIITLPKTIDNDVAMTDTTFGFDTALGSGIAGGADVILLPEIPYDLETVASAIRDRVRGGKKFSIVAVSEGALPKDQAALIKAAEEVAANASDKNSRKKAKNEIARLEKENANHTSTLSRQLEEMTGLESRVTILGHLQRGGTPSAGDRLLATRLGTACADFIEQEQYGVMVAARGENAVPVPLIEVAGNKKLVPPDHSWVTSARNVGTSFGD